MQRTLTLVGWFVLTLAILWLALRPGTGVMVGSTPITLALGMVGVGLCHLARRRARAVAAESHSHD